VIESYEKMQEFDGFISDLMTINKYASLFMEALGVHKVGWQGSLSLVLVINK